MPRIIIKKVIKVEKAITAEKVIHQKGQTRIRLQKTLVIQKQIIDHMVSLFIKTEISI